MTEKIPVHFLGAFEKLLYLLNKRKLSLKRATER